MPFETLPSRPNGFPTTTIDSPSCGTERSIGSGTANCRRHVHLQHRKIALAIDREHALDDKFLPLSRWISTRLERSITWRFVMIWSGATKKPLPRETVFPLASNVSIATADGFIRLTSSGRKSCAARHHRQHRQNDQKSNGLSEWVFHQGRAEPLRGIICILAGLNKFLTRRPALFSVPSVKNFVSSVLKPVLTQRAPSKTTKNTEKRTKAHQMLAVRPSGARIVRIATKRFGQEPETI